MDDLVSKSELQNCFVKLCPRNCTICDYNKSVDGKAHCAVIDDSPIVDAIRVVRCINCERLYAQRESPQSEVAVLRCRLTGRCVLPYDYCSKAVDARKER